LIAIRGEFFPTRPAFHYADHLRGHRWGHTRGGATASGGEPRRQAYILQEHAKKMNYWALIPSDKFTPGHRHVSAGLGRTRLAEQPG